MKSHLFRLRNRRKSGFTLIELIMVLVIITALAALVIPVIDYIRRTSDKASASFAIAQVAENLALYRTQTGRYPGGLDLLMEGDGSANVQDGVTDTVMGLSSKITSKAPAAELTSDELSKMDDLIPYVMQHALGYRRNPGNSGVNQIDVGVQTSFRVVINDDIVGSVYPGIDNNVAEGNVYPNKAANYAVTGLVNIGPGLDGESTHRTARIVVLGVGPSCEAVGKTMVSPPAYSAVNGIETYNRFLAMFSVYDGFTGAKRPQLVGALDSTMDFLNQEVIEVFENRIE